MKMHELYKLIFVKEWNHLEGYHLISKTLWIW